MHVLKVLAFVYISKGKHFDEYSGRDLGRKDAADRYLEQVSADPDGRKTKQPIGIKKYKTIVTTSSTGEKQRERGDRIPREKSTRLRGDGRTKYVVEALHRVDTTFFKMRHRQLCSTTSTCRSTTSVASDDCEA